MKKAAAFIKAAAFYGVYCINQWFNFKMFFAKFWQFKVIYKKLQAHNKPRKGKTNIYPAV